MKRKNVVGLAILIAFMVLLAACQQPMGTDSEARAFIESGTVRIVMPRINPFVQGARAFAFVDSIEVDFYQGEELVKAVTLGEANYDPLTNTIVGTVRILAGSYDKLIVSVFNHVVSTETPVASGWYTDAFVVPEGEMVSFELPLYPYEPTILTEGMAADVPALNNNGERWFAFFAPAEKTRVRLQTSAGALDAYIFGPDARPLQEIIGEDDSVLFDTPNPDNLYYICVVSREDGSAGTIGYSDPRGFVNLSFY